MNIELPSSELISATVRAALSEDRAFDDVTTLATVPPGLAGRGVFLAKAGGVLAGLPLAAEAFRTLDPGATLARALPEGCRFVPGDVLGEVSGTARGLLQAERVALNFVQRLSGIATVTAAFVAAVAGTRAVILDTRKTTPLLRDLEKYAVRCGGGVNHRRDLAQMAMLKDNHLAAIFRTGQSIAGAVASVRAASPGVGVEVEITALDQLEDALAAGPEWILLDNMDPATMAEAVRRTAGRARLEASGGITLATVAAIAGSGVDAISVGAVTHSAPALDISLELSF